MIDTLKSLILTHVERYPALELLDLYRLLHQGTFGSGSPIPNRKTAREWLDHEAKLAVSVPNASLLESVHPEGTIVRLYLNAYQAGDGTLTALLDACVKSSEVLGASEQQIVAMHQMGEWWSALERMLAPGQALSGRFDPRLATLIGKTRAAEDWASLPHSPAYLYRYRPYYRVLSRDHAERLLS